jgi:hypothetical protein
MKKRILMIVIAAAAMLFGATATKSGTASAVIPVCPPFCSR